MKTVTRTAVANLKYNRSRSILCGISIFLTSCLLMIIGCSAMGIIRFNKINAGYMYGEYDGVYKQVNQEQMEKISHYADFEETGYNQMAASLESDKAEGILSYLDENAFEMTHLQLEEGRMPLAENEITLPKSLAEYLGGPVRLGEQVNVSYRVQGEGEIQNRAFTIVGFLPSHEVSDLKKAYGAYVSKDWMEQVIPPEKGSYTVCVRFPRDNGIERDQVEDRLKEIGKHLGIEETQVSLNTSYANWSRDPGIEIVGVSVLIAVIVVLFSVLVIYNIFYVGIIQKVQEFGKLRAMGATRKQLRHIVLEEGMVLAVCSIPLGLLAGYLTARLGFMTLIKALVKNIGNYQEIPQIFSLPVLLMVLIVSFLAVLLSLIRPMRIASSISPVEAMRYEGENKQKKKTRKGYESMNLNRLAASNMGRHRKRTLMTIVTMGLSGVMFVVVANIGSSMSAEEVARNELEKGDFSIVLDFALNEETYPEDNLHYLQKEKLLGENFVQRIRSIEGVKNVEKRSYLAAMALPPSKIREGKERFSIEVLSREDYNARNLDRRQGKIDYDTASKQDGAIYSYGEFMEQAGVQIGSRVSMEIMDGDRKVPLDVTIQASTGSGDSTLAITEDTLNKLGLEQDTTTRLFVKCEKRQYEHVKQELQRLTEGNPRYALLSWDEELHMGQMAVSMMTIPAYVLLAVLGVIGFMNMANTMITSIITRKRELGILQAMGLTNRQLSRMLQMEGMVLTLGTLLISLTLGNALGYAAFLYCKNSGFNGVERYHFPSMELLIMAVVLVAMQLVLSWIMSRNIQRDTLIERIRYQG